MYRDDGSTHRDGLLENGSGVMRCPLADILHGDVEGYVVRYKSSTAPVMIRVYPTCRAMQCLELYLLRLVVW